MDSPQSQQENELYAGFTCTDVKSESDGVVIEVDYDKCKKVAFAEAEVNYPLYKLYDILKEKSEIKLTSKDYVFITWLQPIPPTFHTINQVAYITDVAKNLENHGVPVALIPYIYFYTEKYVKDTENCLEKGGKSPKEKPVYLLSLLTELTDKLPIYPSLILLDTVPSVLGWVDELREYELFNIEAAKKWVKHTFMPHDFIKHIESKLNIKSNNSKDGGDIGDVEHEISRVLNDIPDAPPLAVAFSILFPLQFINPRKAKILLFGLTPRDVIYYIALDMAIKKESNNSPEIFFIPTRSIISNYGELRNSLLALRDKVKALKCFEVETPTPHEPMSTSQSGTGKNAISIPRLLLYHHILKELCEESKNIAGCEVINKALEIYEEIKRKIESIKRSNENNKGSNSIQSEDLPPCVEDSPKKSSPIPHKKMNLITLLLHGGCKHGKYTFAPAIYSSPMQETTHLYLVLYYYSSSSGKPPSEFVVLRLPNYYQVKESELHIGIKAIDLRKIPVLGWYNASPYFEIQKKKFDYSKAISPFVQGKIAEEPFLLSNILYLSLLVSAPEPKQGKYQMKM
jgi:hypothetical protein